MAVKQAVLAAAAPAASDSSATTSEADGGLADMSDAVTSESDIQYNQAHKGKLVNVDKNNFLDYNQTHGSATYDSATGIVTLTPDQNNLAGSVTLKDKIDLNHDFSLTTWTNLGDKIPKIGVVMGLVLPSTLPRLTPLVVPEITSGSGAWQTPLVSSWIPSITRGQR
ncbi:hypothetical protein N219_11320 [Limosilactobacillus fermentum MTCC 8711]|nr:hypothetical protein N219_11320 [Limosilactobacillus fermentum MTCC 8711]